MQKTAYVKKLITEDLSRHAPDGILVINAKGEIQYINERLEQITGYRADILTGKKVELLVSERFKHHQKHVEKYFSILAQKPMMEGLVLWLLHKDGREIPVEINLKLIEAIEEQFALAFIRDVKHRNTVGPTSSDSEKFLQSYFDAGFAGMLVSTPDRKLLQYNDAFCNITGYTREELLTISWEDLTHPDDQKNANEKYLKLLTGEIDVCTREKRYIRKDGRIIYVSLTTKSIFNDQGEVEYFVTFVQDITSARQRDQRLQEQYDLLTGIIDGTNDAIYVKAVDGRYLMVNRIVESFLGKNRNEIIGQDISAFFPIAIVDQINQEDQKIIDSGKIMEIERIEEKDGSTVAWHNVKGPIRDAEGNITAIFGIARDITNQVKTESNLQESKEVYKRLLESSPNGIVIVNASGDIETVNSQLGKLTGYSSEELVGKPIEILVPDRIKGHVQMRDNYFHSPYIRMMGRDMELYARRKDGSEFPVDISLNPIETRKGLIVMAAICDITERKQIEQEVTNRAFRLQKLSELSMTLSGEPVEVFKKTVQIIGELLDVPVVYLSEIREENLHYLSVYNRGEVMGNAGRCELEITPCATVIKDREIKVYDDVAGMFPNAGFLKTHSAYSYCGIPSIDSNGNIISVTCLIDDKPHDFSEEDKDLLRIFGQRIGIEIERQRDVERRLQAEEALKSNEEQFRILFQSSRDAIMLSTSHSMVIVDCNEAALKLFGYDTVDEIRDTTPSERSPPVQPNGEDSYQTSRIWTDKALSEGTAFFEWHYCRRDGTTFPAEVRLSAMKIGEKPYIQAVIRDITERNQAETELLKSKKELQEAQRIGQLGSWKWDVVNNVLSWSDEIYSIFNVSQVEIGNTLDAAMTMVHPDDKEFVKKRMQQALAAELPHNIVHRIIRPDGEIRYLQVQSEVIRDQSGTPIQMVGTLMDISNYKRAEEDIRQAHESLRNLIIQIQVAREDERTRIARDLHDDLAQHLTKLKIDVASLLGQLPKNWKKLPANGYSIISIIDDMQNFVRKLSSELRPPMLDDLGLGSALEWQLQDSAKRGGFEYEIVLPDLELEPDSERDTTIYRIFQEVMTNVIRHAAAKFVDVTLHESDSQLVLSIKDNGIGIKEQQMQDNHSLGLIGMHERAAAIGGKIQIEPVKKGGTLVILTVPLFRPRNNDNIF